MWSRHFKRVTALSRVLPPTTRLTTPSYFSTIRLLLHHRRNRIAFQNRFEIYRRDRTQTRFPILQIPAKQRSLIPTKEKRRKSTYQPSHKINPHLHVFLEKVATVHYFRIHSS
jgi:hypothetical protein